MNLLDYLPGVVTFVIGFALGGVAVNAIRKHAAKNKPFIPEIPFVRVGSPVYIGDDMYILTAYEYEEAISPADSKRIVLFTSVPTHKEDDYIA